MSLGLIPVFSRSRGPKFDALGEVLAAELETLERIASKAKLTPLGTFTDQRSVPEDFDGEPEELEELLGPWNDWFEAAAGAEAVDQLILLLESSKTAGKALTQRNAVIQELAALRGCLQKASKKSLKFRLTLA